MDSKIKYEFLATMWKHDSPGGWYFVSIPKKISNEIRENHKWQEEAWGRMKAFAKIGETTWETAIWFDRKRDRYILPIKSEIRKISKLEINTDMLVNVWV